MTIATPSFAVGDMVTTPAHRGEDLQVIGIKDGRLQVRPLNKQTGELGRARWIDKTNAIRRPELPDENPVDDSGIEIRDGDDPPVARVYPQIYVLLSRVMRDVGAVGKTLKAAPQVGGYRFRGIDAVMAALQPALVRHQVVVVPEVRSIERTEYKTSKGGVMQHCLLEVAYTFWAPDGSSVTAVVTGEGADTGDKSANKALAGAMKYAITQALCIPTEEQKDSEADPAGNDLEGGRQGQSQRREPSRPPERSAKVQAFLDRGAKAKSLDEMQAIATEIAAADLTEVEARQISAPWKQLLGRYRS